MSNLNNDGLFKQVLQAQETQREGWMTEIKGAITQGDHVFDRAYFTQEVGWRDARIARINGELIAKDAEIDRLKKELGEKYAQIMALHSTLVLLREFYQSDWGKCPVDAEAQILLSINRVLDSKPPLVVPLEDVRPLVEAISAIHKPLGGETATSGNPCCSPNSEQGRAIAAALTAFTSKYPALTSQRR